MNAMSICEAVWIAFFVVWIVWGFRAKAVQQREGASSRLSYTLFNVAGYYLMFSGDIPRPFLRAPIFHPSVVTDVLGVAITVAGIAFAMWARVYLGGNWSGAVTVKVDHQLIRTGPYRWVRHPIYTGLISALVGTAIVRHQVRGIIAVLLVYFGFTLKSKIEERTMTSVFGNQYREYSRATGAIIPRLWS